MSQVTNSNKKSMIQVGGVIAVIAIALFVYLMWYVAPEQVMERVKVVAVTDNGCIVETTDGHPVSLNDCGSAKAGDYFSTLIDQKTKERSQLMNPER